MSLLNWFYIGEKVMVYNNIHLFTGCEWNSSYIQAEAGTIPKGNSLCQGLSIRAIPLTTSE